MTQFNAISTPRFMLRPLRLDDVTDTYCGWFDNPEVARYVHSAHQPHDTDSLRRYIQERSNRDDVLFLGIFSSDSAAHIGNIKFEPINEQENFAVMGILIGDRAWRGRGVAKEVIKASAQWLQTHRGIRKIVLGVAREHYAAIAAYKKIGFRVENCARISPVGDAICMGWHLDSTNDPRHQIP